jgi:hypothetical protein
MYRNNKIAHLVKDLYGTKYQIFKVRLKFNIHQRKDYRERGIEVNIPPVHSNLTNLNRNFCNLIIIVRLPYILYLQSYSSFIGGRLKVNCYEMEEAITLPST